MPMHFSAFRILIVDDQSNELAVDAVEVQMDVSITRCNTP